MKFKITIHSGYAAPPDAIDLLSRRLGAGRDDAAFTQAGREIRATWDSADDDMYTRDLRIEIERRAIFDIVNEVCERAPELKSDWFAVSPLR